MFFGGKVEALSKEIILFRKSVFLRCCRVWKLLRVKFSRIFLEVFSPSKQDKCLYGSNCSVISKTHSISYFLSQVLAGKSLENRRIVKDVSCL